MAGESAASQRVSTLPTPGPASMAIFRNTRSRMLHSVVPATDQRASISAGSCGLTSLPECNIRALVFLKQAKDAGVGFGNVETRCDAAISPAMGP